MSDDRPRRTSRRQYVKYLGVAGAVSSIGLAGCADTAEGATGTLATTVTDQPGDIADFESCVVTIEGIWLKPLEGKETTTASGEVVDQDADDVDETDAREYHAFDAAQEADLVELQDGTTELIDEREVTAREYAFVQLDVSAVTGTLVSGGEVEVGTPGEAPLQFDHPFEIREGQRTTFTGDFTPVKRGQTDRYLLQPVASGTSVSYEDAPTTTES
ncbi:MAG: DUF4382 domain-containing protein [Halococcoides sp.]